MSRPRSRIGALWVIQPQEIHPDLERFGELIEGIDLELDLDEMLGVTLRAFRVPAAHPPANAM
jgi:hypothetical protein